MFVRVTTSSGDLSRWDEIVRWANEAIVPAFQQMSGFRGYVGGGNRQTGGIIAITYWETEDQARGLRDSVNPDLLKQISEQGIQLGPSEVYEVTIQV